MTESVLARGDKRGEARASTRASTLDRPIGVLLVGDFLSSSIGGRAVCEDLAEKLPDLGFRVITTSARPGRMARMADMLSTTWRRRREYDVAQIDVFSDLAFVWAEQTVRLLRFLDKPYLLTLHGGNLPRFAEQQPARVRALLDGADAVTTPSQFLHRRMRKLREDMTLVPNPVELASYDYRPRDKSEPHLIWLRAFHQVYNPRMAVRVLASLRESHPTARLTMVGPDKGDGALADTEREIARLGLADRVEITGGVDKAEVPHYLQKGDLFVNTSSVDNAPVTLLEAMACGLPVISTDAGGIPDLVEDGAQALLVPCNDVEAMTRAVNGLLNDPQRTATLVARARRHVLQHDWTSVLPRWNELLTKAVMAPLKA